MLELAKKITKNVQERLSKLTIDETINVLIEEEIKREYQGTDQSSQGTQEINLKDILPPGMDLDNGEIYDIETGETVKEL
ncbi:hypothetical protein [Clostridium perfringens]|uniref:Uncharacterized protein n=3 Tax=Clostridium perfringens TaxID=1502 RepID=A0AAP6WL14_CLOPF|nr:hypothetical protein [Clostridium perfringens]WEV14823.1 hypothetical protein PL325_08740 [Clostridium perfringens D]AOY53671.1 hypothetical protein FORC25_1255 [Clostridium perfringens]EDT22154.1 conserved hypothetical protein [Clostridium perfringens B str. ATCC 3626]EHK2402065.1 hypothetical protein [Clostridium perfringens]EJT6152842.1 hypothetical protein [Clostridium perfringens]